MQPVELAAHAKRTRELSRQLQASGRGAAPLGLAKSTSNLFRDRREGVKQRLDLSAFCHVLQHDEEAGWVDAEGLTSYEALVDATLLYGAMPAVVPQLKTITVAGAVAGVGIEATSFRQGLVHDTLLELDVLLPSGELIHCTPDNAHRDLFFGFPNSFGTLGYAVRLRLRTLSTRPYVQVRHHRHTRPGAFFGALEEQFHSNADFVDGVVFSPDLQVLSLAHFSDQASWLSDYSFEDIYYQSLLKREKDVLRLRDYLWRWDTDWFWCSKHFGAEHPMLRRLLGRKRLNSRHYARWMRWNTRLGLTRRLARWRGRFPESVIQDVDIPLAQAEEFLQFLLQEVPVLPIWICPIRAANAQRRFTLYPMTPDVPYVNFGFWDVIETSTQQPTGCFNRLVEHKVMQLGGIKSLYSDSYFSREEFDQAYGMPSYAQLKAKYDPEHRLMGLFEKCVLRE